VSLDSNDPARTLARLYHLIWITTIAILVVAGITLALPSSLDTLSSYKGTFPKLAVETYLVLVPAAILVFSVVMLYKKIWGLAFSGLALTLIWVVSKVLG
jgi:hypothetical protein